jgi:hypothetical protein
MRDEPHVTVKIHSVLAGLHPFQELSTLDQQLTRTLLLRKGLGRIKPSRCTEIRDAVL